MKITYTQDEYYNKLDEIMELVKYLGDFRITESEKGRLTLQFPNNAQGIAEFYSKNCGTGFSREVAYAYQENKYQDNLIEQLVKSTPKTEQAPHTNAAILEELKNLNETIKAASGYKISVPKTCRCSVEAILHQERVERRTNGLNKAK